MYVISPKKDSISAKDSFDFSISNNIQTCLFIKFPVISPLNSPNQQQKEIP
jgi:hypothetical protein